MVGFSVSSLQYDVFTEICKIPDLIKRDHFSQKNRKMKPT